MKLWKVTGEAGDFVKFRWAGSKDEAKKLAKELAEEYELAKGDIKLEQEEVPTSKKELLEWLNENVNTEVI